MQAEVALPLPVENPFTYKVPDGLSGQIRTGQSVLVPFRNHSMKGVVVGLNGHGAHARPDAGLKEIRLILDPHRVVPGPLLELTRWISQEYACSWGESLALISASSRTSKRVRKPIAEIAPDELASVRVRKPELVLTPEQESALVPIRAALQSQSAQPFLLFGITSSGKTEVYLNAIADVLKQGKQALFLVPEISLCPPFLDILRARFGDRVGLWHSQVAQGEKNRVFESLLSGKVDIVLGARSALFAPFSRLGLIVLDEEHDPSYKQDEKPRYHAREAALKLAQLHGAVLIMGTATPSIETFHRALGGEFALLELANRVPSHSIPKLTVVDRRTGASRFSLFSQTLTDAIAKALTRREQVILALNRRGFSTFYLCNACGYVCKCEDCQLTLVHHQEEGKEGPGVLKCHYCLREIPLPLACPICKSHAIFLGGYGTQKVVQETKKSFPYARILRLDSDIARKKAVSAETYRRFKEESADILVGTQMVTQGFDFPRVTLVGILDADTALYHPDFRSAERTFEWVSQAAGRAGRSPMGGEVIVQSSLPDHYALSTAGQLDYRGFYEKETEFRRTLFYPPFARMVLFRLESRNKKNLVPVESERLAEVLKSCLAAAKQPDERTQVLGPGPAPREHLRNMLRWQTLVKCEDLKTLQAVVRAGKAFNAKSGMRLVIDVDPYEML